MQGNNKQSIEEMLASLRRNNKVRKTPSEAEHLLQCQCVRWFDYSFPHLKNLLFAVPNGGKRDARTARKLKAEGVVAGVSDLILLVPNSKHGALLIEMKTHIGKQSEAQKAWSEQVTARGYRYVVCRSIDDFTQEISNYLNE